MGILAVARDDAAEVPVAEVVALPRRIPVGVGLGLVRVPPSHVVPHAAGVVVTGGVVIGGAVADGDVEEIAVGVAAEPVGLVDARGAIVGEHGHVDGGGLRLGAGTVADGVPCVSPHMNSSHMPQPWPSRPLGSMRLTVTVRPEQDFADGGRGGRRGSSTEPRGAGGVNRAFVIADPYRRGHALVLARLTCSQPLEFHPPAKS